MNDGIQTMTADDVHELLHNLPVSERSRILNEEIGKLPIEKRAEIVARQLPSDTVVLGGNNVNSTFAFQINSSSEELSKLLKELPPDALADLIRAASEAIAIRMKNSPSPENGKHS